MIHIENEEQFIQTISEGITLIDFYATWCGPCRMIAPILEEIDVDYGNKIKVAKVDVDEVEEIAIRYGVNTIPTLLYIKDGVLLEKSVGLKTESQILNTIEKYI